MPNYCDFTIKLRGLKQDIEKFEEWANADMDDNGKYFVHGTRTKETERKIGTRVFECYIYDMDEEYSENEKINAALSGSCAWSVEGCFIHPRIPGVLNIYQAAQMLHLDLELYSCETGMEFSEHILIRNGESKFETESYREICLSEVDSYEELDDSDKQYISEEKFNNYENEYFVVCSWYDNYWGDWCWSEFN